MAAANKLHNLAANKSTQIKTITEFSLLSVGFEDLLHSVCPHDCLQAKAVVAGTFFQRSKPVKD